MAVDPLWEKYRNLNTYQYAANNPMIMIDPSGLTVAFLPVKDKDLVQSDYSEEEQITTMKNMYNSIIQHFRDKGCEDAAQLMEKALNDPSFTITLTLSLTTDPELGSSVAPEGNIIWNPNMGISAENADLSPAMILLHEVDHAVSYKTDPQHKERQKADWDRDMPLSKGKNAYGTQEEQRVYEGSESCVAACMGTIINPLLPARASQHDGQWIFVPSMFSLPQTQRPK